jgi:hypothetical protein
MYVLFKLEGKAVSNVTKTGFVDSRVDMWKETNKGGKNVGASLFVIKSTDTGGSTGYLHSYRNKPSFQQNPTARFLILVWVSIAGPLNSYQQYYVKLHDLRLRSYHPPFQVSPAATR